MISHFAQLLKVIWLKYSPFLFSNCCFYAKIDLGDNTMKNDLISIIVPAYKAEKYINRCLNSLINQTYNNIEIVVVNDGSPDNTGIALDNFAKQDNRIRVVHKENGGVSSARNAGIKAATGKYICFVDIDDEVKPDYVNLLYKAITKYDADVSICSLIAERKKNNFTTEGLTEETVITLPDNLDTLAKVYNSGVFMPPYCKLYKTEKIAEGFPEYTNYGEDEIFNLQYFNKVNKVAVIPESLYIYYLNDASLSHKNALSLVKKRIKNMQVRHELLSKLFGQDSVLANFLTSKFIIRHIFAVVEELIDEKKSTKEIMTVLNDLVSNEQVQLALDIYPKIDKKTNLIWKRLYKKRFKSLILLRKIKMLLKA